VGGQGAQQTLDLPITCSPERNLHIETRIQPTRTLFKTEFGGGMSIKIMTEVWSDAPVSGGDLLVLLALADWADEETRQAYPGMKKLAKKSRLKERQTQYSIAKLEKLGLISVKRNASPLKTNLYHILPTIAAETQYLHPPQEKPDTQYLHPRDAVDCVSDTQWTAPKPSVTIRREPSVSNISHSGEILSAVKIYNECATRVGWTRCEKVSAARTSKLKARLREAGGVEGWTRALNRASASPYLRGEVNDFRLGIDFLLQDSSFTKLNEGFYDERRNGKPTGAEIAERAAARWTARQLDSGPGSGSSQPLLSARQPD